MGETDYGQWGRKLAEHFFRPDCAGQPVVFFVDDEALDGLVEESEQGSGAEQLLESVRSRLAWHANNIFFLIFQSCQRWGRQYDRSGHPDSLPLLALSVLAATRMHRDEEAAAHNYYIQFRRLLGLDGWGKPKGYDIVFPWLWEQLNSWLEDVHEGRLGHSTITSYSHFPNIGYALSQALFRASDQERLGTFFTHLGLAPGETMQAEELLSYFRAWVPGSGLSRGAERMAKDPVYEQQLRSLLLKALQTWDGVQRDSAGRRSGAIRLALEFGLRPWLGLVAERPPGAPGECVLWEPGGRSVKVRSTIEGWYDEVSAEASADVLSRGLHLEGEELTLDYRAHPVVPFSESADLGCWVTRERVSPLGTHWVLCRSGYRSKVEGFLHRVECTDWRDAGTRIPIPDGWSLLGDVVVDRPPEGGQDPDLRPLAPVAGARPQLSGGLPLPGGRNTYLVGGEPEVWIPETTQEGDERVPVDLGAGPERVRAGTRIALRDKGLEEGHHELAIGPSRLTIRTVFTLGVAEPTGTANLSHWLHRDADGGIRPASLSATAPQGIGASDWAAITGGWIDDPGYHLSAPPVPPLILHRAAAETVLIGARPGDVDRPGPPPQSPWLDRVGLVTQYFELHPPFDVAWVLSRMPVGGWSVRLRRPLPPDPDRALPPTARQWAELLLAVEEAGADIEPANRTLWEEYLGAARAVRA